LNDKSPKKRQLKNSRPDVYRDWQSGGLDGFEVQRERKNREMRASKRTGHKKLERDSMDMVDFAVGLVVGHHRRTSEVVLDDGSCQVCRYHPLLDLRKTGMLTVGDQVLLVKEKEGVDLFIRKVLERKTKLSRPGPPDREHREQILAANIDRVVVVASIIQPEFNPGFVNRYMMICAANEIPMILVLNKSDLFDQIDELIESYSPYVERLILCSAISGQGLEELRGALRGCHSVLTGQSGVGKSSLINALFLNNEAETGEVREKDGKGRHTTTSSTLFKLDEDSWVIDTPGIRRLGFWQMEVVELALMFPYFREIKPCRFNDCLHINEPGCEVLKALENGSLAKFCYDSYLRIFQTLDDKK
jgi:ribosome biogenesis GTPase / thiamine phosphate phosphatase